MNTCAKPAFHTHRSKLPKSVIAKLVASLSAPQLESTRQYLTDSYGPGLSTSRDLPASVGPESIPPGRKAGGHCEGHS